MTDSKATLEPDDIPVLGQLFLAEVNLRANPDWEPVPSSGPSIATKYQMLVLPADSDGNVQVQLRCELSGVEGSEEEPSYTGVLIVVAFVLFKPRAVISDDRRSQIAAQFSTNMLIGEVRTHVRTLTALGPHPMVLIGASNRSSLLKNAHKLVFTDNEDEAEVVPLFKTEEPESNKSPKKKRPTSKQSREKAD